MPHKFTGVLLFGLLAVGTPNAVAGQAFTEAAFDSLSRSPRVPQLSAMRDAATVQAADIDVLLRGGFAALRLWELAAQRDDADAAKQLFERAITRDPISAWGHFGLGLALARGPGIRIPSPNGILNPVVTGQVFAELFGLDPRTRAVAEFRAALKLEPAFVPAALQLASLALQKRADERLHEARNALVTASQHVQDRRVWLMLADVEAALGLTTAAQNAAENLLKLDSTSATAHHALARALFLRSGKTKTAAEEYFTGLAAADSTAVERYFEDVAFILSPEELLRWGALPGSDRPAWIRKLWELRAARAGVTVEERIAEHYRRMAEAWSRYPRSGEYGAPPAGALVVPGLSDHPFDDRGVLFVRHGAPIDVISTITNGFPPNETWVYNRPDTTGFRLFNFMKYPGTTDYRLMAAVPPCDNAKHSDLDPAVKAGLLTPYDARWVEGVVKYYEDRGKYEQRYHQLGARCYAATIGRTLGRSSIIDTTFVQLEGTHLAMELQRDALIALESDSDAPDFDLPIRFIHRLYSFRGRESASDLTAAVLIPGDRILPARTSTGNTVYPVSVSLILMDPSTQHVARLDSTLYFESKRVLTRDDFLRLHVTISASLGSDLNYRLVVRDAVNTERGGVVSGIVPAQQLTSRKLKLSDIVIAESDSGRWERGRYGLSLMPPHEIDADRSFVLFYEIYNIPAARPYTAEVAFERGGSGIGKAIKGIFGGSPSEVRLRFSGETERDEINQVSHRISSELAPGEYKLRITVTDQATLQSDTRVTTLVILPRASRRTQTDVIRRQ